MDPLTTLNLAALLLTPIDPSVLTRQAEEARQELRSANLAHLEAAPGQFLAEAGMSSWAETPPQGDATQEIGAPNRS